jgi:hypothetical protein
MSANGAPANTATAQRIWPNIRNSIPKMTKRAIGTTRASRALARWKFSNCPPQSSVTPGGSWTFATAACASLTKDTRSRPRTFTSTRTRRWSDSRLITEGPSTGLRSASAASGRSCPPGAPTRSSPNPSGVAVRGG